VLGLSFAGSLPQPAAAQSSGFHWAYASYFGTGRYTLDGHSDTVVLSFAPAWSWRQPSLNAAGERTIGFRFRLPVSIGTAEFDSLDSIGGLTLDSVNAFSVVPGVEVEIPVSERLSLKPLGYVGMGWQPHAGDRAGIFRFGLRARLGFRFGDTRMHLVQGVERIGYAADAGDSDALNLISMGLDFDRPLNDTRIAGSLAEISWHLQYTRYLDSLGLDLRAVSPAPTLSSEWELGAAFGKQDGELRFWRLRFDRVGIAYRFSASGDFAGVGIVFRSLFDR
jgi:hypothetical protein